MNPVSSSSPFQRLGREGRRTRRRAIRYFTPPSNHHFPAPLDNGCIKLPRPTAPSLSRHPSTTHDLFQPPQLGSSKVVEDIIWCFYIP